MIKIYFLAIRALRKKAFDYLLKPINRAELFECIQRIHQESKQEESRKFLFVKDQGFTVAVDFNDIVYLRQTDLIPKFFSSMIANTSCPKL
jgi:YesN/AraC family two-component response regulator